MKKLKKLSLESMKFEIPVLNEDFLKSIVGGYSDDCFWRCIAYLNSGGTSYSESDAEIYANSYYGPESGLYYYGAATTNSQMKEYIGSNYGSDSSFNIIQFDPSKAPDVVQAGSGSMTHVVVFKQDVYDNKGNVIGMKVYDPQQKSEYTIPLNSVLDILGPSSSGSSSGGGSSSSVGSGSWDSHASNGSGGYGSYGSGASYSSGFTPDANGGYY